MFVGGNPKSTVEMKLPRLWSTTLGVGRP